jgi:hypothetical protein
MRWKPPTRTSLVLVSILTGFALFLHSCDQYRMSDQEIDAYFSDKKLKGTHDHYYVGNQRINFVTIGKDSLPLVLFVHGSPASLSAFIHFMADEKLLESAQLISVDRPASVSPTLDMLKLPCKNRLLISNLFLRNIRTSAP